ncbi:NADP-dependent oxidoreductase domain-containing protein [Trichoderma pleuroticola]
MKNPLLTLRDGNQIPMEAGDTKFNQKLVDLIKTAIEKGFYHLDCAEMYGNEEEVGRAIHDSRVPREKLFITNKVSQGIYNIRAAIEESLKKCRSSISTCIYLIHTPYFAKSDAEFQRAWKSMEEIKRAKLANSIGVSNYLRPHVEATLVGATISPALNQIEFHPYLQRGNDYLPWLRENGLQTLSRIAKAHNTTEAAVLIHWIIQNGVVAVTTTTNPGRLDEYAQALEITLEENELQEITDVGSTYHFRTSWSEHFEADDRS